MAEIKDKVVTAESLKALHDYNKETYMNNVDPVGNGSLSINRKPNTDIGTGSVALGYWSTASGNFSYAEGGTTISSGMASHAEGGNTVSSGFCSHSEGNNTVASSMCQHVQGIFNIEDSEDKYLHIVGNGNEEERSNAHTLDWEGNAWYAGDISADGNMILSSNQYGDTLPAAGIKGRIFFKKLDG